MIKKISYVLSVIVCIGLFLGSWFGILSMGVTEVLGFITGALCVWLTVKENIWNWPIGTANSVFFAILFWQSRLFADMGLQVVYIVLGFLGWYWWIYGGKNKSSLRVSHLSLTTGLMLILIGIVSTFGMMRYLVSIQDSSPFLDALTTVMSLVAQYLLTKKYIENWYVWISADLIYIYLYFSRGLSLTAVLYFIFLCMCVQGLRDWVRLNAWKEYTRHKSLFC